MAETRSFETNGLMAAQLTAFNCNNTEAVASRGAYAYVPSGSKGVIQAKIWVNSILISNTTTTMQSIVGSAVLNPEAADPYSPADGLPYKAEITVSGRIAGTVLCGFTMYGADTYSVSGNGHFTAVVEGLTQGTPCS